MPDKDKPKEEGRKQIRCSICNTLLMIIIEDNGSVIEIKCRKCGEVHLIK